MKIERGKDRPPRSVRGGFTMWDAIAILIVLFALGVWFAFNHLGERGRVARCRSNLKTLGQAMKSYANDHDDGLPAGAINVGNGVISWDTELAPYLNPGLKNPTSVYDRKRLMATINPRFVCPSDTIQRKDPRSYAMSSHYMKYAWPPTPDDKTGVGVLWNRETVSNLLGKDFVDAAFKDPAVLPRVKLSMLPDPENTLLLSELIMPENMIGHGAWTLLGGVNAQKNSFHGDAARFHFGKFNYLMADGHVELLAGSQTTGQDPKSHNIWTINPKD